MRLSNVLIVALVCAGGIFSTGCSGIPQGLKDDFTQFVNEEFLPRTLETVKKEGVKILDQAKDFAVDKGKEVLANATAGVEAKVQDAIQKQREKEYAKIDEALAKVPVKDATTGLLVTKTWKDFDVDKDGILSFDEQKALTAFAVKSGDLGVIGTVGLSVGTLALLGLGAKGTQVVAKKIKNGTGGGGTPPAPAPTTTPPTTAAPAGGGG